jgi:uroporphyrinogen-III synthase
VPEPSSQQPTDILKGLRALLVRPEQEGDAFVAKLMDDGAVLSHCPVMEILSFEGRVEADKIKPYILDYSRYDRVIFISRTAAKLAIDWLDHYCLMGPGLPVGTRYYAVGKSTAAVLKNWDIEAELPSRHFNSEELLALPSLQHVDGEEILIFCGEGGRHLLEQELRCRGAVVHRCELYRRQPLHDFAAEINRLLSDNVLDVVVAHSAELLNYLLEMVEDEQRPTLSLLPLLVPGERIKALAEQSGFKTVICADSAVPEDMVSALRGWYSDC